MKVYIVEERSQSVERNPYTQEIEERGDMEIEELFYCSTPELAVNFAQRYIDNEHYRERAKGYVRDDEWWMVVSSQNMNEFDVTSLEFVSGLDWNSEPILDFNIKGYDSKNKAIPFE